MSHDALRISGLLVALVLALACGGSGGGGAAAPDGPVDISRIARLNPATRLQARLTGDVVVNGDRLAAEATIALAGGAPEEFEGIQLIPVESSTTIEIPSTGVVIASGNTAFVDTDGFYLGSIDDMNVLCVAGSTVALPIFVSVGDSGFFYDETCDNGTSSTARWRAEPGKGTLDLSLTYQTTSGSRTTSEISTYRFREDGEILGLRTRGQVSEPGLLLTFDLSGAL